MVWKYYYIDAFDGRTPNKGEAVAVCVEVQMRGRLRGRLEFSVEQFDEIKAKALRAAPSSPIYSFINLDAEPPHITAEQIIDSHHDRGVY